MRVRGREKERNESAEGKREETRVDAKRIMAHLFLFVCAADGDLLDSLTSNNNNRKNIKYKSGI